MRWPWVWHARAAAVLHSSVPSSVRRLTVFAKPIEPFGLRWSVSPRTQGSRAPLGEPLARLSDEDDKLNFRDHNHCDIEAHRLARHEISGIFTCDEQRLWQLLLMALRVLQKPAELGSSGFFSRHGNELGAENKTARRIQQRNAVKVSIALGSDRHAVETERNPGFIDLKLLRMKHAKIAALCGECRRLGATPLRFPWDAHRACRSLEMLSPWQRCDLSPRAYRFVASSDATRKYPR